MIELPRGFRFAGVHCGLKQSDQEDISLIVADKPCTAAAVYTQNRIVAAPVVFDRLRTPSDHIRAVVVNSGNANACTGKQGDVDTEQMARLAADAADVQFDQVLVMSTGIIGEPLDMSKLSAGIAEAGRQLAADLSALMAAARGMMTTDKTQKIASERFQIGRGEVTLTGLAKGAGMIGPRMATMLSVIVTDAALSPQLAQRLLARTVEETFNCISVEGHTSTNDTVVLLANGRSSVLIDDDDKATEQFSDALLSLCTNLCRKIPDDGEGATHLIEIQVEGCQSRDDAIRIARNVADSPLVKTAIAGGDPNWGRMVSAAGYAGVPFDPETIELRLNGTLLYRHGSPVTFDAEAVSRSIRSERETKIHLCFTEGSQSVRFWTSDLTHQYVTINADYHT